MKKLVFSLLFCCFMTQCHFSYYESSFQSSMTGYSYRIIFDHCDTGNQSFIAVDPVARLSLLCQGLQNEQLNHGCAENERRNLFEEKCIGWIWKKQPFSLPTK